MNTKAAVSRLRATLVILLGAVAYIAPLGLHAETAATGAKVLFILDASGSMWGKVEGKEKIVVAARGDGEPHQRAT